jgi:ABC-type transporter Mla subunit MlaD
VARIPGIDSAFALLSAQAEALERLPEVVTAFAGAVRGLGETVQQARETIASVQRLTARAEAVVAELEQPLKDLAPGLQRLAVVLDDPVVSALPETVRKVQDEVLPVLRTIADTHDKVAAVAGSTDRLLSLVDTFSAIPGAGLLGRRRPGPPPTTVVVEQDPPTGS